MGVTSDQGSKGAKDALHFLIAGRDLLLGTIRERAGLGEREDMCRPLIPLQRFVVSGLEVMRGSIRCEVAGRAPSDKRTEKAQASHPGIS